MAKIKYRPEIDGLRTAAVFAVIIYHINSDWLPSGFVGVDVFLVISGFLITSIILKSHDTNDFSIMNFYIRRIKRIIPLTYAVIISILIFGWFLSYPIAYRAESNSAISALYFIANIRFALMGDYFQSASDNPLLHLWSLSLEEQFYFVWPLFIGLFYKFNKKNKLFFAISFLIVFSVILAMALIEDDRFRHFAFFLLPTRMTGLLFGAILSIGAFSIKKNSNYFSWLGTVLLLYSFCFIGKDEFPGISTLLPLLGTGLIILTPESSHTNRLYSNNVVSYLGKISFSLYMWHWPLLVYSRRYIERNDLNIEPVVYVSIFLGVLIAISSISYFYIENFFRKIKKSNRYVFCVMLCLPLLLLTFISLYISKNNGLALRYGLTDTMTRVETLGCHSSLLKEYCYINKNNDSDNQILLIGDSHAGAMNHFTKEMALDFNKTAYDASAGSCTFYSKKFKSTQCERVKDKIIKILSTRDIKYIFVAKRFDRMIESDVDEFLDYLDTMSSKEYKIVLIKQVPKLTDTYLDSKFMDNYLSGKILSDTDEIDMSYMQHNLKIELALVESSDMLILDFEKVLCENDKCKILDENGFPLYYDEDHLSAHGSEWVYDKFKRSNSFEDLKNFIDK